VAEAELYVADLASRWTLVTDTRVVEVDRPANYELVLGADPWCWTPRPLEVN
jgi:hypothetical protein